MKVSELRIGNLILKNGKLHYTSHLTIRDIYGLSVDDTDTFEPIQITEEWLVKFGFEYDKRLNHYYHPYISLKIDITDNMVCISDSWEWEKSYYVHQLQNLYFALKGEELTINQ